MSARDFCHVHTHSHYSLLEALPKIDELVAAAKADGQSALALTDNGNFYGAIEFYKECKKEGIKPILGCDFFVAPRTRHDKEHATDDRHSRLVLLAKNETGYHNLIHLVSASYLEGFHIDRPRIDRELLERHHEGLIAILSALEGEHAQALRDGARERAEESLQFYKKVFGDDCFVEITKHPEIDGHHALMEKTVALARACALPLVAAQEIYYLEPDDAVARELVDNIRTGHVLNRDFETGTRNFSFLSRGRMEELFKDLPEALENTTRIAESCNLELTLGKAIFPQFPIPEGSTADNELREKAERGIRERALADTPELRTRINHELGIIAQKDYASYFLIVADLLAYARETGIYTNTRGSAAGSLVSYLCGITTVDPIKFQMPFERFLNPERPSAPDIDMDIADNRRDDLINYARKQYGDDRVVQIGTFGTMLARAAVRDVSRALGHSYGVGDRIAKLIPFGKQGFPVTIAGSLEEVTELKDAYKKDADAREILDLAKKIEGNARHVGVHAAGVVIAPSAVTNFVPIQHDPKGGKTITQYDMYSIADEYGGIGLLKFDFLGLKNLSVLADSVARVKKRLNADVDLDRISLEDRKVYEMLARGETLGVFQMAGGGMTNYLKELRPTVVHDLNAMVALYRPGPMAFIPEYIERKRNPARVRYLDPRLEKILKPTYGVLIYQDDVMMIAVELAGYSWGEADKLRKAMGKKIPEQMRAQKERFMTGCVERGMKKDVVQKLWEQIETFAAYGFNKCLTGDTRVVDAETGIPTPIATLKQRQSTASVCALNDDLKLAPARASRPFENGVKQIYRLQTRAGRIIRATDNHPFRTLDGWTSLGSLLPGTRIAAPRRLPQPTHVEPLDAYRAATLGYLIAEGNMCHPHGIYFYSKSDDEIYDFIAAAKQFPNAKITIDRSKSATSIYVGQVDQRKGNALHAWITDLGLVGKSATEKHIPDHLFSVDNDTLALFLGKMWQGDGCASVQNQLLFYATSSRRLADDVQHMLLRFGIISTIHTKQFRYRGAYKAGWTVNIQGETNFDAFMRTIGRYLIGAKKRAASAVLANSRIRTNDRGRGTSDTIPASIYSTIRSEMAFHGQNTAVLAKCTELSERIFGYDARKKGYTRSTLQRIGDALDSSLLKMQAESDIFWDEVVSIEADGKEMTYDLSVPGPANFVANGLIVHNSHAASYGNLAYKTAYMKANFPVDYMAAVLTADAGDVEKIAEIIAECTRMGLAILPPSINDSYGTFTVTQTSAQASPAQQRHENNESQADAIRFGLYSIKNFGTGVADSIIAERQHSGPFISVGDFIARVPDKNLNKKSLEALIMSGALDEFAERKTLLGNVEILLTYHREHTKAPSNQDSLFGASVLSTSNEIPLKMLEPATMDERLLWEKELLGFYISGHPLDKFKDKLTKQKMTLKDAKENFPRGVETVIAGFLETTRPTLTKKGDRMLFGRLADYSDGVEIVAFPRTLQENPNLFNPGMCIMLKGKFSDRNGEPSFVVERAKAL